MKPVTYKNIPEKLKEYLPTENDIRLYEDIGWYISPIMLPEETIDDALIGVERFYNGEIDFQFAEHSGIADDEPGQNQVIRNNEFVTLRNKELKNLGFHPLVVGTAASLARTNGIRLFADSLILKSPEKPSDKGIVGWHSDKAYWPTCTSDRMLTAWIPLQDCTVDMGPVAHINSSHRWKDNASLKKFFSFNNQNLLDFEDYLKRNQEDYKMTPMVVKKGQVCFHNCHTIHSSFPNTSNKDRLALAIHFQDLDNSYQAAFKENGEPITISYDRLCKKNPNGDPDYSDENIFPLLFKKEE